MNFLSLALKSLRHRRLTTFLTVLSLSLSTVLLLAVERTKRASEEGFTQSISQVDLIVGGRGGALNLLLYSVFNIGNATNNVSWESFQEWSDHPAVDWTIPYSLGDSHRGYRVVGTNEKFYQHYRFRGDQSVSFKAGAPAEGIWDVVLGADVAQKLNYKLGDPIVLAHGVTRGEGVLHHDNKPFVVTGILNGTGTAIDRSLYITLEGMVGLHVDWKDGAMPSKENEISAENLTKEKLQPEAITAFFLRTKSRIETLRLQRDINTYKSEPLIGIIPGVVLGELWQGLGYFEKALKMISWMVVGVGLTAMLIALLTSLNERRREMAILRSLGASPMVIVKLLVFESAFLTVLGVMSGVALQLIGFTVLQGWLENAFGLYLVGSAFTMTELSYILATIALGTLIGFLPAWQASRRALKDGLTVKI